MPDHGTFLSAEWRDLVLLNYEVDPLLLRKYLPRGVELGTFEGRTFVSVVGFQFLRTKLFGLLAIPFHTNFEEVNLRFYVRRQQGDEHRRGVVFIRELVPRAAVAGVARLIYGERYSSCRMSHEVRRTAMRFSAIYGWSFEGHTFRLGAEATGPPMLTAAGSLENFITEHYWGYSARANGSSLEYHVSHIPWKVWTAGRSMFEGDAGALYGPEFGEVLRRPADSAFIADGSAVVVHRGHELHE
jgi:uncharacterized protein